MGVVQHRVRAKLAPKFLLCNFCIVSPPTNNLSAISISLSRGKILKQNNRNSLFVNLFYAFHYLSL